MPEVQAEQEAGAALLPDGYTVSITYANLADLSGTRPVHWELRNSAMGQHICDAVWNDTDKDATPEWTRMAPGQVVYDEIYEHCGTELGNLVLRWLRLHGLLDNGVAA